ncbi:MAG: DUF805 domain-containing protein [Synechococcaceae cyanobacterium RL_1_2]|nr:DUF805 domain-containing protein [Synechococcaceae cyanobacterium RL_1_2]
MEWYVKVLRNYATFTGRARRAEYWYFVLFNFLIAMGLAIIEGIVAKQSGILGGVYQLGVIIPSLAVACRRLHDTGRSGWWMLIGLIPLIGAIVLIVFFCQDSQPESNEYGPNPKKSSMDKF